MLHSMFGQKVVRPANDFRNLEVNGGVLTRAEWKADGVVFIPVGTVMICSPNREYEVLDGCVESVIISSVKREYKVCCVH